MGRKSLVFFPLTILLIALDQATKFWVYLNIQENRGRITVIDGFFDLTHVQNPGAAFSALRDFDYRIYVFILFGFVATGIIVDLWRRLPKSDWFVSLCLGLILSGAVGNLIDRIHKQTVTDFMRFYTDRWPELHAWLAAHAPGGMTEWPTWNVADAALVVGVGLYLVHYLFLEDKEEDEEPEAIEDSEAEAAGEGA